MSILDSGLFFSNEALQQVYLSNNKLIEVPGDLFATSYNLEVLDLANNGLVSVEPFLVSNLLLLRSLLLNNNTLASVPSSFLQFAESLTTLYIWWFN